MKSGKTGILIGVLVTALAVVLTVICVNTVLEELNRGADEAFAATYAELSGKQAAVGTMWVTDAFAPVPTDTAVPSPTAGEGLDTPVLSEAGAPTPVTSIAPDHSDTDIDTGDGRSDGETPDSYMTEGVNNSVDISGADGKRVFEENEFTVIEPDGTVVYHVQWGDTLSGISYMFGVSVDELAEYNHIKDVNLIYAASALRIPTENWR